MLLKIAEINLAYKTVSVLMESVVKAQTVRKVLAIDKHLLGHLEVFQAVEKRIAKILQALKIESDQGIAYADLPRLVKSLPKDTAEVQVMRDNLINLTEEIIVHLDEQVEVSIQALDYSEIEDLGISAGTIKRLGALVNL